MNILQFEKVGTLSETKLLQWNVPGWVLNHKYSTKRSDLFTHDSLPNFKFCLLIRPHYDLSGTSTSIIVQLYRIPVFDLVKDREKPGGSRNVTVSEDPPVMDVRFILLKADSIFKWSFTMKMQDSQTKVTFPEITTFDSLTILCMLTPNPPCVVRDDLCESTSSGAKSADSLENSVTESSLVQDMEALLNKGTLSDVTLCVDGKEFNAHRCILASRSTVFAAMFNHDTLEQQESRIVIVDFASDVVYHMLKYMYTEEIEELSPQQYLSLLSAADKYALLGLKKKCSNYLRNNMTADLVVHVLIVADLHQDVRLKEAAIKMYLSEPTAVMNNEEWIPFMKNHTQLAHSILMQLAKKSTK